MAAQSLQPRVPGAFALRVAAAAIVAATAVFGATLLFSGGDSAGHSQGHLIGAAVAPLVAAIVARWRPRSRFEASARLALVGSLWLAGAAQGAEAIGALGWEANAVVTRSDVLVTVHDVAVGVSLVGMLLTLLAAGAAALSVTARLALRLAGTRKAS